MADQEMVQICGEAGARESHSLEQTFSSSQITQRPSLSHESSIDHQAVQVNPSLIGLAQVDFIEQSPMLPDFHCTNSNSEESATVNVYDDSHNMLEEGRAQLLAEAADADLASQSPGDTSNWAIASLFIERRSVSLVLLVFTATATFGLVCNITTSSGLNGFLDTVGTLHAMDVMFFGAPKLFYVMLFSSAGFMSSMSGIAAQGLSLPCQSLLFFGIVCLSIVYYFLVDNIIPKFLVRIGSHNYSSSLVMWFLALALILSTVLIWNVLKYLTMDFGRLIRWIRTKITLLIFL